MTENAIGAGQRARVRREGALVYQANHCGTCHLVNGVGMKVGPPLNGLSKRRDAELGRGPLRGSAKALAGIDHAALQAAAERPGKSDELPYGATGVRRKGAGRPCPAEFYFLSSGASPAAVNWPLRPFMSRMYCPSFCPVLLRPGAAWLMHSVHSGIFYVLRVYEPSCPA